MRRPGFTGDVWPDEIQQLILQAALLPAERSVTAWAAVRPRIDVDYLPGELHRLMPLLSKTLTQHGVEDRDLARLKGVYQFSWYRNTMLFTEAAPLLRELQSESIETLVLRGAAIALGHRSDFGTRHMNDMDVLVRDAELDRARLVAAAAGWRPVVAARHLERRLATAPVRNNGGRVIRLHWLPSPNLALPGVPMQGIWDRAVPLRVRDVDTLMLSPADHLVHTCVDGARANSGASLRWVADAMTLLSTPAGNVDWGVVVSEARRLRASGLLSEALRYLKDNIEADVPAPALAALATTPTSRRDRVSLRLSLTTTPRVASAAEILGRFTRLTADLPVLSAAAVAPEFLANVLEVERRRDVPKVALNRVLRGVRSPTPSLASLSRAGVKEAKSS